MSKSTPTQHLTAASELLALPENIRETGTQLWDEIAKGIAQTMSDQLIPVINEIYHRDYPPDAKITFISTEYVSKKKLKKNRAYARILSDITFRIEGSDDVYHLEFQVSKDGKISIRMLEYDFHISLQHSTSKSEETSVYQIRFPMSAVIYPDDQAAPKQDHELCEIIFQDGSTHMYRVPIIKISDYQIQEIIQKRLNIFLPFSILRFRSRLSRSSKQPVTKKELTDHLRELILGLDDELTQGVIDQNRYTELIRLVNLAIQRVFHNYPDYVKEANKMTERKLKFISEIMQEKEDTITLLTEKNSALSDAYSALSDEKSALSDAYSALSDENATLKARIMELEGNAVT